MTPLEALREIARCGPPVVGNFLCAICKNNTRTRATGHEPHKDFCPWRHMPQIVKALEAAEAYLAPRDEGGGSLANLLALEDALKGGD